MNCVEVNFSSYKDSTNKALDKINVREILSKQKNILLKPNLVNSSKHPITTHPDFCEAMIEYIKDCSKANIVIAEGCGEMSLETHEMIEKPLIY